MKNRVLFICLALSASFFFSAPLSAQVIKGHIIDYQGEPIPYVSIFIKELAMGTLTGEKGEFEIKAPAGSYTCSFQHMSYEPTTQTLQSPANNISIKMTEKLYELPMATVGAKSDEDPAYSMVRKAIGMAPLYMSQLNSYKANVYLKGSLKIIKLSGLIKMAAKTELKEAQIKEGDRYVQETVNEITYNQGRYHQVVKSISNTFPEIFNLKFGLSNYNIYNPDNGSLISPISPQAFSYYTFKYEGFSLEGEYIVNRIKVIPKHKNAMTLEGYIFLSDGFWNVLRFELSNESMGVNVTNRQLYGELDKNVWMPISNAINADINIMGNKANTTYASSIKYDNFVVNPNIKEKTAPSSNKQPKALTDEQKKAQQKSQELAIDINQLMSKNDISNSEAFKLSKLIQKKEKEDRKLLPDSMQRKKSLNLNDYYKIETDSTAKKYDSTYWNNTRPMPLASEEVQSYKRKDSLKLKDNKPDSLKKASVGNEIMGVVFGKTYRLDSTNFTLRYGGLIDPFLLGYNLVDGWTYKQTLDLNKRFKDTTRLRAHLEGEYAFSRKRLMFDGNVRYDYYPEKRALLYLAGGIKTTDFNSSGLSYFDNMFTSLIFRRNYINLYENRYINIGHSIEPVNGLTAIISFGYQDRRQLENTTDYSFFYRNSRTFRPNIPLQNPYINANNGLVSSQKSATMVIEASYTPQMYYRQSGRVKYNVRSKYPTFSASWSKGFEGVFNSQSNFDQIEFSVTQTIDLNALSSFKYNVTAGWFPNNKQMHFREFKHFDIKEFELLFSPFIGSYNLLQTYMPSTNEWYAQGFAQYTSPYMLLKYLPLLDRTMIMENLYAIYLTTPNLKNYTEVGYGLTNIYLFGSLGVFVGFEGAKYHDWGFKISFDISSLRNN